MQELLEHLTPALREKVERGELLVFEGQRADKPVLRDAYSGKIVKGSGRPPKANDIALISRKTAFKRTRTFSEAFDAFIPSKREDNPEAIISLEELIDYAAKVARGWHSYKDVDCPSCNHHFSVEMQNKPDAKLLSFLIERRVGKAKETMEINTRSEQIIAMLSDKTPVVEVIALTPKEKMERTRAILDAQEEQVT